MYTPIQISMQEEEKNFSSMCVPMSFKIFATNDSNTLANIGVREMGLNWSREFIDISFGMGVIAAVFQQLGKTQSLRHLLKI